MALIVQKFGGTSVGTLERIQQVAAKVIQTRALGHDVVVVVSAMSGETDRLIQLAKTLNQHPDPREYAALLATGEQVSIALLTMALISQGCQARSYTGAQAHIQTDSNHTKARILAINSNALREDFLLGRVPVVAGFQGVAENGEVTTLGRGGSDTTAVALAAALQADECQIYTDVDGIYTADPRIVPKAQRLDCVTFEEMLELASLGAKVVQQRAMEFAGKFKVPLRVLSTFVDGPGTLVNFNGKGGENHAVVTGITSSRNEACITVNGVSRQAGVAAEILTALASEHIEIDMLQQTPVAGAMDFMFTVGRDDYQKTLNLLHKLAGEIKPAGIAGDPNISKISVVGVGLRSHPAIIGTLLKSLDMHSIQTQLISTSEIKVSAVIEEKDVERSMQILHTAYGLDLQGL